MREWKTFIHRPGKSHQNPLPLLSIIRFPRFQPKTYHELSPSAIGFYDGPLSGGERRL